MAKEDSKYINREISWLSFNERVLQEAEDPEVPLIERIKFIGIFSSNLDEFFRVRVGTLLRMVKAGIKSKAMFGGKPKKILNEIYNIVVSQRKKFEQIFEELLNELEKAKIFIINEKQLNTGQKKYVQSYFEQHVRPGLVPIMLDTLPKFPNLKNQVIYLAIYLKKNKKQGGIKYALIEIPTDDCPRFIVLPKIDEKIYIILLDDVIRYGLKDIFSIFDFDSIEAYTIKLTRDAELEIEDDVTKSTFEKISKSIKQRQKGQPVRFVYDDKIPDDLLKFFLKNNHLEDFENLIPGGRYHNAKDFMNFPDVGSSELRYEKFYPLPHKRVKNQQDMFTTIREGDILFHYPYQSFDYVIDLLREAAIDPKVTSIKMTLYRVAKHSNVVNALINAIRNGKAVTVLMELQARFDEESNIYWTQRLKEEGAHMIGGVPGLKVHSKLCHISRKEQGKLKSYSIIGTGNYNESTARLYSDHALFTADKHLTNEVNRVFVFLDNNYKTHNYKHLIVSPFFMRKRFIKLIKNEIQNAQMGKQAYIYIKLNSLVDRELINKLYEASSAGVKIKIVVRSICSLIPGISGLSENIEAFSIVDKYLEHSRIFVFCNNGDEKFYISSADWMIRNLDNRVEVAAPIYEKNIQNELKTFFELQFKDNKKARIINDKQNNTYRNTDSDRIFHAQNDIYEFLSKG